MHARIKFNVEKSQESNSQVGKPTENRTLAPRGYFRFYNFGADSTRLLHKSIGISCEQQRLQLVTVAGTKQ